LDITLDLTPGVYKPYIKDNDTPVYVNNNSNHPKTVLKNIPLGVNRRLTKILISKEVFDAVAPPYQEALKNSGYNHTLQYQAPVQLRTKKKNRKINVTWFNPPYSCNVKSNVGKDFLHIIETAFPPNNPLHKPFNSCSTTVKISYRCMPSTAQAIAGHNTQVLKEEKPVAQQSGCNCDNGPASCQVQGKCKSKGIVYEARVTETVSG
jgi:hypothetical protein